MARGTGSGTRGGSRAASETPAVRQILTTKSPIKGLGNLVKAKRSILDANGNMKSEEDVAPDKVLLDMAGKTLEEAEKVMAIGDVEHAVIYDAQGRQILVKTSMSENYVDFTTKESKAMAGGTFTHNHPLYDGMSVPFSRGDVSMLRQNKIAVFRAVSGNTVFEMRPPPDSLFNKTSGVKLKKLLDLTFNAAKSELGYALKDQVRPMDLVKILDRTMTIVDSKLSIGYKKYQIK
jgi:hypothetical protein